MYTKEELFANKGWARLHDAMVEAVLTVNPDLLNDDESLGFPEAVVSDMWDRLPQHIQNIAHEWTIGDTVFGDEAYNYILSELRKAE